MPIRRIRQGAGLHTDRTALEPVEGGMRQADDVLIYRPGIIEPRLGFGDATGVATLTSESYLPVRGWPYGSDIVLQMRDPDGNWKLVALSDLDNLGAHSPPSGRGASEAAQMRENLYATTSAGVYLTTGTSTAMTAAGVPTDYHTFEPWARVGTTGTGERFACDETSSVAYRYCWVKRDANDYLKRSAPSPRIVYRNSSASSAYVGVSRIYLPSGIVAGDFFELYRTTNSGDNTIDPGDELFLASVHEVTAANVSAGYIDVGEVWDQTLDDELGPALYTNSSQGGILANANELPPLARSIAQWADVMWYGHTTERAVLTISPISVYDTSNDEHDLDGVHFSTGRTGDFFTGSPLIDNVSAVGGLKVGQYITDTGYPVKNGSTGNDDEVVEGDRTYVPAETKIASFQTLITINNNTNIDTATPDSISFPNLSSVSGVARIVWDASIQSGTSAQKGANAGASADNLAAAINASNKAIWGMEGGLTATSDSNDTVLITNSAGHAVPVSITESTPSTYSVTYRVVMDANAKATGNTQSFDCCDYIVVNGTELYFNTSFASRIAHYEDLPALGSYSTDFQTLDIDVSRSGTTTNLDQLGTLVRYMADGINAQAIRADRFNLRAYADDISPIRNRFNNVDLEQPGPTSLALIATDYSTALSFEAPVRPDSFRVSSDGSMTSLDATVPGRLFWSKIGEPEAVPLVNYVDVGNRDKAILRLVPLEDALLVFKEDGIFRVTGAAPSSWVVDDVDLTRRLLSPQCVAVLDNVAYAWTDRGLVAVTEGGVVPQAVSQPIADVLRVAQQQLPLGDANGQRGYWMAAHQRLGLVVLSLASSSSAEYGAEQYVWSRTTGAWTRWDRQDRCMVYDPAEDRMLACPAGEEVVAVGENGFSASNYYAQTTTAALDGSATMTRSALFRFDGSSAAQVISEHVSGGNGGWYMQVSGSDQVQFGVYDGGTFYTATLASLTLSAGTIYAATGTLSAGTLRVTVTPLGGSPSSATAAGTFAAPTTGFARLMGEESGTPDVPDQITILGFAWDDATALNEAQAQAHNAATLAAMEMQQIGSGSYYRAGTVTGLADDLSGAYDWTENGTVTKHVAITLDHEPFAYYERADRTAAASYVDATKTDIPIVAVSGSTVTVRRTDLDGFTIPACSVVYVDPGESLPGYQGYGRVTASADSSTYGAGFIDLTISFESSTVPATVSRTLDVYQGWSAAMLWQAQQLPGLGNRWQEHHVAFEAAESAYLSAPTFDVGGAAHRDSSPSSVAPTFPSGITYSEVVRTGLPRACVRTPHLYPYIRICGAGLLWELSETTLHHTPTSRKVAR